jgi:hypothetical protein
MARGARGLILVMTVTCAWLLAAGPAGAQTVPGKAAPDQIVLSGRVVVPRGETVGEIIVLRGRAVVAGVATRDVVVVNGPVAVSGQVSGDVVVLAAGDVHQGAGAQVGGQVRPHLRFTLRDRFGAIARLISWFAVSVSVLLLGLLLLWLVPTGSDRVVEAGRTAPWASILWGLAAAVLVPAIAVAFLASVIALPLGLAAILALAFLVMLGYAFGAMLIGRIVLRGRSRTTCFLVGWVILRAVGLIPIVSGITVALVAVVGIGASLVATWRARGRSLGGRHRPGRATSAGYDPVVDLVEEEPSTGFA